MYLFNWVSFKVLHQRKGRICNGHHWPYGSETSTFNGGAGAVSLFTVRQRGRVPDYLPSRKAYDHFFLSHTSFSQLKDAALKGRLHNNPLSSNGVAGRSIAWKVSA